MPFCTQCGANNPDPARFCDQCGAELIPITAAAPAAGSPAPSATAAPAAGPSVCPQCGSPVIPGEAFCENCGASLLHGGVLPTPAPAPVQPAPDAYPPPQPTFASPPPAAPAAPAPKPTPAAPAPAMPAPAPKPAAAAPAPAPVGRTTLAPGALILASSSTRLPLPAADEALVGRADPVSNFFPDVDLSHYGALQHGVGRRHMRFFIKDNQVYIEDLDSTNGTFLNRQRLPPKTPQPVRDGDEIALGTLVCALVL